MTNSLPLVIESGIGSASPTIRLLEREEIEQLTPEEAEQYWQLLSEYEQELDRDDVANGLTLDFTDFVRQAWTILEPTTALSWSFHYELLAEWLTLISSGEFKKLYPEKLGLVINVPPRSGKSIFATVCWPVWTWLTRPSRRFLFGSHSYPLATDHNKKRRQLIESTWFQGLFGNRFKLITSGGTLAENDHTGRFQVTSVGAKSTGLGGDILIGDDLLDRESAWSEAVKKQTNSWLDSSWGKLRNNPLTGVYVHISQRLAVDDPTGHILGEDGSTGKPNDWIILKIRREEEERKTYLFPISGKLYERVKGDVLDVHRYPNPELARLKAKSREWANQEQQEPTPATGNLLNPGWIKWYRGGDPLPTFYQVIVSVDANFKEGRDNDLVAMHKYGLALNRRVLLDRRTEQIGFAASKQAIKELARGGHRVPWLSFDMPPATQVLIENKANGPAIAEQLRADPMFGLAVIEYNPTGSKTQRFIAATGDAEGGLVWMPEDAPWIGELRKTLCDYAGEGSIPHDDDCDAWSQLINWSRQMQYGLLGYLDKLAAKERAEQTTHRYEYVDEFGKSVILEWDPESELWRGPDGQGFAQGPADTAAASNSEAGSADSAANDGAGPTPTGSDSGTTD